MQTKTIQKNIANKLTEWLTTIKDEQLRIDLKKNVLVSGGSITSMFLKEDVNDYDVYIKDIDVLLRLVEYYTKPFNITILDGRKKAEYIAYLEDEYADYLKFAIGNDADIEDIQNAYAIAIAVRNLHPDQIKIFILAGGKKVNELLKEDELNYTPLFFSPNAISLSNKIQIVIRFHGDDVAIHKTFDFIHATNFFTFETGLVTNKEALECILTKQLKYQGSMYPLTSVIRMKKFVKKGWNVNAGEILKMLFQVSLLDLTNPDVLEEQLIGVDVAYFNKLIEILRSVEDKTKMTSQYLNTIIDKVFNEADTDE